MLEHRCEFTFDSRKIDECTGQAKNTCFGIYPMYLEVWHEDKDGLECYFDNYVKIEVNFCPFCGLKAQPDSSKREDAQIGMKILGTENIILAPDWKINLRDAVLGSPRIKKGGEASGDD